LKEFYIKYFNAKSCPLYENKDKEFKSYFLQFEQGSRLEIMTKEGIETVLDDNKEYFVYCHIALKLDSVETVKALTKKLSYDGYNIVDGPRLTGDGYFESVFLDPDNNKLELTC